MLKTARNVASMLKTARNVPHMLKTARYTPHMPKQNGTGCVLLSVLEIKTVDAAHILTQHDGECGPCFPSTAVNLDRTSTIGRCDTKCVAPPLLKTNLPRVVYIGICFAYNTACSRPTLQGVFYFELSTANGYQNKKGLPVLGIHRRLDQYKPRAAPRSKKHVTKRAQRRPYDQLCHDLNILTSRLSVRHAVLSSLLGPLSTTKYFLSA